MRIVILGAGTIGCYLGGHWTRAGMDVTLLGRPRVLDPIASKGLRLDQDAAVDMKTSQDPAILAAADMVVLTLKSTAIASAITDLSAHLAPETPVLCLLNGLSPVRDLKKALPKAQILGGMVPFNVVWDGPTALRKTSIGDVIVEKTELLADLVAASQKSAVPLHTTKDIKAVQYGKLLLNLNNPVNALSGETLHAQLTNKTYRQIYAAAFKEALEVYAAAGIQHAKVGPLPAKAILRVLGLPDLLFNTLAVRVQKIDRTSMTSMAVDLAAGRETEIDSINGEIVALARKVGMKAPVNTGLVRLVHQATQTGARPQNAAELRAALGL